MTSKKISFGKRPSVKKKEDEWVKSRGNQEVMKRFTIDLPESLHRAMKADCAERGVKMAVEIRALLETKFLQ